MTRAVYKYSVQPTASAQDPIQMNLPLGAEVLSVGQQGDEVFIWAAVDPMYPTESHTFYLIPTGGNIPNGKALTFVGTVHLYAGRIVAHLFKE